MDIWNEGDQEKIMMELGASAARLTKLAREMADAMGESYKMDKYLNYYSDRNIHDFWESSSAQC